MDTLRQSLNRRRTIDEQLEALHSQQFCDWYRDYVRLINVVYKFYRTQIRFSFIFPNRTNYASLIVLYPQVDSSDD